jgi:tRNA/tmRNA/rRNA uracil-C5-methylase (TrmA/RlmC/RlmD family)
MAKAYPNSQFFGFDYHDKSIEAARESAKRAGVSDRVTFRVSKAKEFPGESYDRVAFFDCLHDMGTRSELPRTSASPWPRMGPG